jgi:hypothetical protein
MYICLEVVLFVKLEHYLLPFPFCKPSFGSISYVYVQRVRQVTQAETVIILYPSAYDDWSQTRKNVGLTRCPSVK